MAPRWEPYASGHRGQCLTYDAANNHHTMLILAMREWMGREPLAKLKPYYTRTDPVNVWYYDNGCLWKCACWEVCVYGFYDTFEIDEVFRNRCDIVMEPYLRSRVALNAEFLACLQNEVPATIELLWRKKLKKIPAFNDRTTEARVLLLLLFVNGKWNARSPLSSAPWQKPHRKSIHIQHTQCATFMHSTWTEVFLIRLCANRAAFRGTWTRHRKTTLSKQLRFESPSSFRHLSNAKRCTISLNGNKMANFLLQLVLHWSTQCQFDGISKWKIAMIVG